MKKCLTCKFTKSDELFGKGTNKCNECKNREARERKAQARLAVLDLLGGRCVCCNIAEPLFLDVDHIKNDGFKDRRKGNKVTWMAALREPERFQLLCRNCNWAKHLVGNCPHQQYRVNHCE